MRYKLLFICTFLFFSLSAETLQKNVELKNNWLKLVDDKWEPLHWKDSSTVRVAGIVLPKTTNVNKDYFVFDNRGITDVYVNNNFFDRMSDKGQVIIPIEDLKKLAHSESLFITLFAERGVLSLSQSFVGRKVVADKVTGNSLYQLIPRTLSSRQDQVLIIFYLLALFFVISKVSYQKVFNGYFNWSNMVRNIPPEENIIAGVLTKGSLYIIILMSAMIGLELTIYQLITSPAEELSDYSVVLSFLKYALVIMLVVVIKYFFLKYFGALVGTHSFYKRHYFEYLRIIFTIALFILLPMLVVYLQGNAFPLSLKILFLIGCVLGVLRLLLITTRYITFSFLYLFSYICTSEIVPILIVTKFLF